MKKNKDTKKEYQAAYYEKNKDTIKAHRENNMRARRYYCDVCDLACRSNHDLKKHLGTLKHSYAWVNALD